MVLRHLKSVAFVVFLAMMARAERVWPGAGVEAVAGKCATVTVTENEAVLRAASACPATVWPAVYFTFSAERDLSKAGAVRVTLTNRTDRALRVGVKVKAVTVQGRLPDGSFVIPPFAAAVKDLRLFAESWAFDKPHGLLGLKRNPGVGGGSSYSLERVKAISVYLPAGLSDHGSARRGRERPVWTRLDGRCAVLGARLGHPRHCARDVSAAICGSGESVRNGVSPINCRG